MKTLLLTLLLLVPLSGAEEQSELTQQAHALIRGFSERSFEEQKKSVKYAEELTNEAYLKNRFERISSIEQYLPKVISETNTKHLHCLIIEENPGDLDPILFYYDDDMMQVLLNITHLRGSGLEDDEDIQAEYEQIILHLDALKKEE